MGEASPQAPAVSAAIQRVVDAGKRHGVANDVHSHDAGEALGWQAW